jgi:TetR/AcrR family transcriptional repressor of nem operon
MARPREFDADAALEHAMHVFWNKGYEATSLDDLCKSTGLGRSSLYAAFGDKRGLYFKALERYEAAAQVRVAKALSAGPLRSALAAFIGRIIDDIVAGPGRRGCFIGNCAAELSRMDRTAANRVRRSLERTEAVFADALALARDRGEFDASVDVKALAEYLVAGIHGLRLIGKAKPERAVLAGIAANLLCRLDL